MIKKNPLSAAIAAAIFSQDRGDTIAQDPFKSEAQRRYLYANEPEVAEKFAKDKQKMTARKADLNGWYEIKGNPLSKVGVFPYLGSTIDRDGSLGLDKDRVYKVLRPAEELADPACVDSFKLLPWINDHEMLGGNMTPAEQKGVEGVIGEEVYFDPDDQTLKGNIKIFSENMKTSIDFGKEELSCGYRCKYTLEGGIFGGERYDITQRTIRGNHLALVDQGRMGPEVAVLDESERFCFTIDSKELQMDPEKKEGEDGGTQDMSLSDVTKVLNEVLPQIAELQKAISAMTQAKPEGEGDMEEMEDAGGNGPSKDKKDGGNGPSKDMKDGGEGGYDMDAILEQNKALQANVEKLQSTVDSLEQNGMKTLMGQIASRDALADDLSKHIGTFDHSEMTLDDVAKYGVDKLELTCDSGHEVATLKGFLHNRQPAASSQAHGMDSKGSMGGLDSYLKGEDK